MKNKLTCLVNFMKNPLGIDHEQPSFSWSFSNTPFLQTSYRLCVAEVPSTDAGLTSNKTQIWDSGLREGSDNHMISYEGPALKSGTRYSVTVTSTGTYAENGASSENEVSSEMNVSGTASFTTGILSSEYTPDWDHCWVGGASVRNQSYRIRMSFNAVKPVAQAAAFAVSPNYYMLTLDGFPAGDMRLNNAFTDPTRTLLYESWPLSIIEGAHVLSIELGNGWFAMERAERGIAIGQHMAAVLIRIEYTDGEVSWIASSSSNCLYCDKVPSIRNNVYKGETRDLRLEQAGWDTPSFHTNAEAGWKHAFELDPPGGQIRSQMMEPIRITQELVPLKIIALPDGSYTADFGQNFAGWVRLSVQGNDGDQVDIHYAELVYEDGRVNESSLNGISSVDQYILAGSEKTILEPSFTYHGFRYVQIYGLQEAPTKDTLVGCVAGSDLTQIDAFSCGNELLNQFEKAVLWTERSNFYSIPTDCPQRAERVGWNNDVTVRHEASLYHFRLYSLFRKWLGDIRDAQGTVTGAIPDTAPYFRNGQKPADPVSSAYLMLPWNLYLFYGDTAVIRENYDGCRRWAEYLDRQSDQGIVRYSPMGDWASPKQWCDPTSIGAGSVSRITPGQLMSTGFQFLNWKLLEKMAKVLDLSSDAAYFCSKKEMVRTAFMKNWYHTDTQNFAAGSQASNALPLYFGMLDAEQEDAVFANLLQDIRKQGYHLTTGNICSRFVPEVLFLQGHADDAFRLLTQKTYPSWGFMFENGATTMWERWEKVDSYAGVSKMASHNHAMSGSVSVCFIKYLAGIRPDENAPGFKNIIIRPLIPHDLPCANASLSLPRGTVSSEWTFMTDETDASHERTALSMTVTVPSGCTADVYLPLDWCKGSACQVQSSCTDADCEHIILKEGSFLHTAVNAGVHKWTIKK